MERGNRAGHLRSRNQTQPVCSDRGPAARAHSGTEPERSPYPDAARKQMKWPTSKALGRMNPRPGQYGGPVRLEGSRNVEGCRELDGGRVQQTVQPRNLLTHFSTQISTRSRTVSAALHSSYIRVTSGETDFGSANGGSNPPGAIFKRRASGEGHGATGERPAHTAAPLTKAL